MTTNEESYGRNVTAIITAGYRVVYGSIPREVRSELSAAVKAGVLGRIKKSPLTHEVFFAPSSANSARWFVEDERASSQAILDRMFTVRPDEYDTFLSESKVIA